jgi:AcrR family transcriptional regulator
VIVERSQGPRQETEAAPPVTTREARGARTKERIVVAAAEAFADGGYNGVNLNEVVLSLDLTKGALYYFFPTKDKLVREIVGRHFALFAQVLDRPASKDDNRLDIVVHLTYRVGDLYQHDPITRAGDRLAKERHFTDLELPVPSVSWMEKTTRLLRQAKTRGEMRDDRVPKEIASVVVSFFYGAQTMSVLFPDRRNLITRLDSFWDLLLPTLRPR